MYAHSNAHRYIGFIYTNIDTETHSCTKIKTHLYSVQKKTLTHSLFN